MPQPLGQALLVQAKQVQAGQDQALRGFPVVVAEDPLQPPSQPWQQWMEQKWVLSEEPCPEVGMEAAHRSPGH